MTDAAAARHTNGLFLFKNMVLRNESEEQMFVRRARVFDVSRFCA